MAGLLSCWGTGGRSSSQPQRVDRVLQRRVPTCLCPMFGLCMFQNLSSHPHGQPCFPKVQAPSQVAGPGGGPGCVRAISPPDNQDREEPLPQSRLPLSLGPFQPGFVVRTLLIHKALCFSKQGGKSHFFHEVPGLQGKCIHSMGGGEQG